MSPDEPGSDALLSDKAKEDVETQAAEAVEADRKEDQLAAEASTDPDPEQTQYPEPIDEGDDDNED